MSRKPSPTNDWVPPCALVGSGVYLSYAQNAYVNNGVNTVGSRQLQDPVNTILYADTDGWDACLYADREGSANVCYRHSGGNERSTETQRVTAGAKRGKFRANAAFADQHVESRRDAPSDSSRWSATDGTSTENPAACPASV